MKKNKLKHTLKKLAKAAIREYLKEKGLLGAHKNRVFKSKKKYDRKKYKEWKDEN